MRKNVLLMTSMGRHLNNRDSIPMRLLVTHLGTLLVVLPGSATLMQHSVALKVTCSPSSLVAPLAGVLAPLALPRVPEARISRHASTSLLWMLARVPSVLWTSILSRLAQRVVALASGGVLSVQLVAHVMVPGREHLL